MRRTDLLDTTPWAHEQMLERLRQMTPAEKFKIIFDRIEMTRQIHQLASMRIEETKRGYSDHS